MTTLNEECRETTVPEVKSEAKAVEFLPLYRPPLHAALGALTLYLFLALLFRLPFLGSFSSVVSGGKDAAQTLRLMEVTLSQFGSLPWFTTDSFYPWTGTLGWSDTFFLPTLAAAPLVSLGVPLPFAVNVLLLLASVLSGYFCFRLLYQLTGNTQASTIGGVGFLSWLVAAAPQLTIPLQFAFFLPLILSSTLALIGIPTFRGGLVLGALIPAALLTSIDLTVVSIVAAILLVIGFRLSHPYRPRNLGRRNAVFGFLIGVLPILVVLPPYFEAAHYLAPLDEAALRGLTAPPNSFVPAELCRIGACTQTQDSLRYFFPGWLVLIGASAALARLLEPRRLGFMVFFVLTIVLFLPGYTHALPALVDIVTFPLFAILIATLGTLERRLNVRFVTNRDIIAVFLFIGVFFFRYGNTTPQMWSTSAGPPLDTFSLIVHLFPFLPVGVPAAGAVCLEFTLIVLAAFAMTRLVRRSAQRSLFVPLVALAVACEGYRAHSSPSVPLPEQGAIYRYLAEHAQKGDALIVVPLATTPALATQSDIALPPTIRRVGSFSGRSPKPLDLFPTQFSPFPSSGSIQKMSTIVGLRYIIVDESGMPSTNGRLIDQAAAFGADIQYRESDGNGHLLFEYVAETRVRKNTILFAPSRPRGVLRLELKALYEANEPHIPITLLRLDPDGAYHEISEATVTANGSWSEFSFPLPDTDATIAPMQIRFEVPPQSRIWFRRTGFAPQY